MPILTRQLSLATTQPIEAIDVTGEVRRWVASTGVRNGLLTLMSRHTTARVNINEREPQLQQDMATFLKRLAPRDGDWLHNRATVDGRDNAHSHLLGLFINASESVPVTDGALALGDWQSIFFIELDGPRERRTLEMQLLSVDP